MGMATHARLCLLLAAVPGTAQTDAHLYSPGTNLERSELAQLETATRTLDAAMYSFTDQELAEELATLARRGVRVRVYRDREQFSQEIRWRGIKSRVKTKSITEFGDFQTPAILALAVTQKLRRLGLRPHSILEPTCGEGAFVMAAAASFPEATSILGVETNPAY